MDIGQVESCKSDRPFQKSMLNEVHYQSGQCLEDILALAMFASALRTPAHACAWSYQQVLWHASLCQGGQGSGMQHT